MFEELSIVCWPDPRLTKVSKPVEAFDDRLSGLAARMLELMREARGVGFAAPQIGLNIRMFVMNATGERGDERVYVNPVLTSESTEQEEAEEGCLSLPGIHVNVLRDKVIHMKAQDLQGRPIEETASGYLARIWQHEFDHLNGTLLLDRMGPVAKMANRHILKDLEARYAADHPAPPKPRKRIVKR